MYWTCDDIGIKHKGDIWKLEKLKKENTDFKCTLFVIAKDIDNELLEWLKQDWIEVAVHAYEHDKIPELDYDDFAERIEKALKILKPVLPKVYGYRSPGFQMRASAYPILKKLGFSWIAHTKHIQSFDGKIRNKELYNSHIYENNIKQGTGCFIA